MSWSPWSSWSASPAPCRRPRRRSAPRRRGSTRAHYHRSGGQRRAVTDEQPADVVGLEEPLVRIDGDRVGPLQPRDPPGVTWREPRRPAVRRVDVEPQPFALRDVGELVDGVDRTGVGGAATPTMANGVRPAARSRAMAAATGAPRRWKSSSPGHDRERRRPGTQLVQRPSDRVVRLVADVDPGVLEVAAARRAVETPQPTEMQVASQRHRHEIRHHPATVRTRTMRRHTRRGGTASGRPLPRRTSHGARVPHVDALVGHLGERLAGDRHRQRGRREVAELAWVLAAEHGPREAGGELAEHVGRRRGIGRCRPRVLRVLRPGPRRSSADGRPRTVTDRPSPGRRRGRTGSPAQRAQVASPNRSIAAREAPASRNPMSSGSGCQANRSR